MIRYTADPNMGDARIVTLVASIGCEQDARNASIRHEREWIDLDRERELREVRSVMHQRHSFAG